MRTLQYMVSALSLMAGLMVSAVSALALPVTNNAIFGTGNINGDFTVDQSNGVEIGLRGKLRYDTSSQPQNIFNYDGISTYNFDVSNGNAPLNRSIWNFEWSINSDYLGTSGVTVGDLTYNIGIDFNPGAGVTGVAFDPINIAFADHSFGNNSTAQGAGVEAANLAEYATLLSTSNLVQQSWNLGFFLTLGNPQLPGIYTISLAAFDGTQRLAGTSIDIVVSDVPLPATLPLFAGALALLGFLSWRRNKPAMA